MTDRSRPDRPCDSDDGWVPAGVDIVVPVAARVYDYALGGVDNFGPDRELFAAIVEAYPAARLAYWANRAFVYRAVARLLDAGIRQFVDLGAGMPPESGTVHEWVHDADPAGRVFYVDIDPIAVEHTASHLTGTANAWAVRGDLRDPDTFLLQLADHIDLDEPVAVLAAAVIHHLPDDAEVTAVLQRLAGELVDGSYLALTHAAPETTPASREQQSHALRLYERTPTPITLRTAAQITAVLGAGWTSLRPGVANPNRWLMDLDDEPLCPPSLLATIAEVSATRPCRPGL
jgi:hypothetical protein